MNRKRLFALVLSVLMVLTLVPALGEEAAANAVGWDTSVEDEIIVTVINGYYTAGEQKLAEEYMALHPETKVTIDVIADNNSYTTKMQTVLADITADTASDIVHSNFLGNVVGSPAAALEQGRPLPVMIFVGGPPSLTVSAVMPLPEGLSELRFAGLLGGRRVDMAPVPGFELPVAAEADFCLWGHVLPELKPEGPFGDHVGYYSLAHDFPVLKVEGVRHRADAIWPFTAVGRPPQEDTVFGDFIHELTGCMVPQVFAGVREVHAVDAAGVHPLLLALGSERYTPYEAVRRPREVLTAALHLLGTTQTALAKYLVIAAHEDAPGLQARDVPAFFRHVLERTDFARDLHFFTHGTTDTLDYTGLGLHEGSKLVWAAVGDARRRLGTEPGALPSLPEGFGDLHVVAPGIVALRGPRNDSPRGQGDARMEALAQALGSWEARESFPLVVVVDDAAFAAASFDNFLWVTFTRSDPAADVYGAHAATHARHWTCEAPLIIDARTKPFHAPALEEDPEVERRVDALAAPGGPLHGIL